VLPVPNPEQPAPTGALPVGLLIIHSLIVLCGLRIDNRLSERRSTTDPAAICDEKGHIVPASRLTNRCKNV